MSIEVKPELGEQRDIGLMAKWVVQRLELEKDIQTTFSNPELPVSIAETMDFQANLLDHLIPIGIQRSKRWGVEELAVDATRTLQFMLTDERERRG